MVDLGELSAETLLAIHSQVDPNRPARELRNLGQREVSGDKSGTRIVKVHYGNYFASFCNGEYECRVKLDRDGSLLSVEESRNLLG